MQQTVSKISGKMFSLVEKLGCAEIISFQSERCKFRPRRGTTTSGPLTRFLDVPSCPAVRRKCTETLKCQFEKALPERWTVGWPAACINLTLVLTHLLCCQATELGRDWDQFRPGSLLSKGKWHWTLLEAMCRVEIKSDMSQSLRSSQSNRDWDQGTRNSKAEGLSGESGRSKIHFL